MFLRLLHGDDSSLVEVLDLPQLFDPFEPLVLGRLHAGEELQEPQSWPKAQLRFPSGGALPACWLQALEAVEERVGEAQNAVVG
ncbi:MAG: acetyltransferase [Cyanobium sp.]